MAEIASKNIFDRFADAVAAQVARAWFFSFCVIVVILWVPSLPLFGTVDTWQLVINTFTTIVTFLLMALLQNAMSRADAAAQQKLNAIANALAHFMDEHGGLDDDVRELRESVGLEATTGTAR